MKFSSLALSSELWWKFIGLACLI